MSRAVAVRTLRLVRLLAGTIWWSTADLASHLGVSGRTIERDLSALRDAGLPLQVRPAAGGQQRRLDPGDVAAWLQGVERPAARRTRSTQAVPLAAALVDELRAEARANPGRSASEIARRRGLPYQQVQRALAARRRPGR